MGSNHGRFRDHKEDANGQVEVQGADQAAQLPAERGGTRRGRRDRCQAARTSMRGTHVGQDRSGHDRMMAVDGLNVPSAVLDLVTAA